MNDDHDDAHHHHQRLLHEAQQQINLEERIKLNTILDRRDAFPCRTRNKIDVLVTEYLEKLKDDIHDLMCNEQDYTLDADSYQGLDSACDTEAEVETALRFISDVLARKGGTDLHPGYPIQLISSIYGNYFDSCNLKAVSFIYLFARLAIEFNLFEEEHRGGLLCEDYSLRHNVLNYLLLSDNPDTVSQEQNELVDSAYLQFLIQLRQTGLLLKQDIQDQHLVRSALSNSVFSERRFQFLVEWDPTVLLQTYNRDMTPLHHAAGHSSIRVFQVVFEYGIHYYPNNKGIQLLFRTVDGGEGHNKDTPFNIACAKFGRKEVRKVVDDTLVRYSSSSSSLENNDDNDNNDDNTPPSPLNSVETVLTAAIDDTIHLDCIYFLIQREPDILFKLLPPQVGVVSRSNSLSTSMLTAQTVVASTATATSIATATATGNESTLTINNEDDNNNQVLGSRSNVSTSTESMLTANAAAGATATTAAATATTTTTTMGDESTTAINNEDNINRRDNFFSRKRRRKKRNTKS